MLKIQFLATFAGQFLRMGMLPHKGNSLLRNYTLKQPVHAIFPRRDCMGINTGEEINKKLV